MRNSSFFFHKDSHERKLNMTTIDSKRTNYLENYWVMHTLKDEIQQTRDIFYNFECSFLIPIDEKDLTRVDFNKITNDFKNVENDKEFIKFTDKLQEVRIVPDKEVSDRSLIKGTVEIIKDRVFTHSHYDYEDVIIELRRKLLSTDETKIINNSCVEEVFDVLLPDEILRQINDTKGEFDSTDFFYTNDTVDKIIEQYSKLPTEIIYSYAKGAAGSCWSVQQKLKAHRNLETIRASELFDFGISTKFKKVA